VDRYSLTHLSDEALRRDLSSVVSKEKEATTQVLAHIAEFDERRLYLPHAYHSMLAYCQGELGLSEDAAKKRIRVARVARRFPAVFEALAGGRIHLSGLVLLATHLDPENAEDLLAAAAGKSRDEIERMLAERYPSQRRPATFTTVAVIPENTAATAACEAPKSTPEAADSLGIWFPRGERERSCSRPPRPQRLPRSPAHRSRQSSRSSV